MGKYAVIVLLYWQYAIDQGQEFNFFLRTNLLEIPQTNEFYFSKFSRIEITDVINLL